MKRVELLSGINLNVISDEKFKTNSVSINFITPLTKEDVTVNAILPNLLEKGYDGCSDFIEFNHKLEELYGASAQSFIQKVGDYQIVTIYATAIDDKFTLNKESITNELCSIVCKMAFNPIFKDGMFLEKEVELEKQTLCDIISSEINDKGTYAILKGISEMCSDEPYGIYKNGFIDKAKEITAKSATEAYKNLVKKSRIEIMFVGCGNPQEEIFKNAVSQLDRQYIQLAPISMHIKSQKEEIVNRMNVNQAKLFMGMGSDLKNNDSATKIMATILGGSPTSKFFVNVREKLSLCYFVNSGSEAN
ncbi:MAG: insulinase family protein, partial [Oscillospiraceae bacterium]